MLGLNDFYIAHHPPVDMGSGLLGHELGDGAYAPGVDVPCFRSDRGIFHASDFKRDYRLIYYLFGEYEADYWTRIEDGRIGIVRHPDSLEIPGFLLATTSGARASLDASGRAVTVLIEGDARISGIDLGPGTWIVSLHTGANDHLQLSVLPTTGSENLSHDVLRIMSNGEKRSFRVFGNPGLIYGIVASRHLK